MSRSSMRGPSVRDEAVVKGSLEATVEQRLFIFAFPARPLHVSGKESAGCIQAHIAERRAVVSRTSLVIKDSISDDRVSQPPEQRELTSIRDRRRQSQYASTDECSTETCVNRQADRDCRQLVRRQYHQPE